MKLENINISTEEGRLLVAALAVLTVDVYPRSTPDEALEKIGKLAEEIYRDYGVRKPQ